MKTMRVLFTWLPALLLASCVYEPRLIPGPGATLSAPDVAYTRVAGVQLWAQSTWQGDPVDLTDVLTPVRVTIENKSGHQLRVSYRDFALVAPSGFRYAALPPFALQQPVSVLEPGDGVLLADYHPAAPAKVKAKARPHPRAQVRVVAPRYPHTHFYFAPPYNWWYPGAVFWPHPWAWNVWYSDMYRYWPEPLPTQDMQAQALPEGVLQDGGSVSGYLYFQQANRETSVQLELTLVDADTNQNLGVARLPFVMVQ